MDFFKSVFSEEPTENTQTTPPHPSSSSSWSFGSTLLTTIATKSESLLDNYYKDLQEFSSGLKNETSVIRRAIQDLPARLDSGAAIAQESLEAVGQAIDNVGSTFTEIIGKDLNFTSPDAFLSSTHYDNDDDDDYNDGKDLNFSNENAKPYSRIEAMIRGVQCNFRTYCDDVEEGDGGEYDEWKLGFKVEERREEIERLVEENRVIKDIYDEVVPVKIDEETFWCRYFYKVDKVVKAEEARARFVKRAISGEVEEEELSWDVDDDDDDNDDLIKEKGKGVEISHVQSGKKEGEIYDEDEPSVSGTKGDILLNEENLEERLMSNEKEGSDGKIGSDISIISSQRSSHVDDLGWDEIEDISDHRSPNPDSAVDFRKRLSASEEDDEELTWDIEDDDDEIEAVKS